MRSRPLSHRPEVTDGALVRAAQQGDRDAFDTLVRRAQRAVYRKVWGILGPGPLVQDIAQDAFLAAWRGLCSLRDVDRFGTWVCRIAENLADLGHFA
jgi:RNA polymerase sigma-70 factor (ECF subfamily)